MVKNAFKAKISDLNTHDCSFIQLLRSSWEAYQTLKLGARKHLSTALRANGYKISFLKIHNPNKHNLKEKKVALDLAESTKVLSL